MNLATHATATQRQSEPGTYLISGFWEGAPWERLAKPSIGQSSRWMLLTWWQAHSGCGVFHAWQHSDHGWRGRSWIKATRTCNGRLTRRLVGRRHAARSARQGMTAVWALLKPRHRLHGAADPRARARITVGQRFDRPVRQDTARRTRAPQGDWKSFRCEPAPGSPPPAGTIEGVGYRGSGVTRFAVAGMVMMGHDESRPYCVGLTCYLCRRLRKAKGGTNQREHSLRPTWRTRFGPVKRS